MKIKKSGWFGILGLTSVLSGYALYKSSSYFSNELMDAKQDKNENRRVQIDDASCLQIRNDEKEVLNGYYFDYQAGTTMVIIHPYRYDSIDMLSYVDFFKQHLHCNFLLIDLYGHGGSDGDNVKLGGHDQEDLLAWIRYLDEHYDGNLVLFGKEMGANVIVNASNKLNQFDQIKAVLLDGAYKNVDHFIAYQLQRKYHVCKYPFIYLMKKMILNRYEIDIDKLDSAEKIKDLQIPTLFIHTKKDRFVPIKDVFDLYNNAKCEKELFILKDQEALYELEKTEDHYLELFDLFLDRYVK